jgi:hypothetical protein
VRVKIKACGVCHSDFFTKEGIWPGIQYPRVPGDEIAGIIDAIGRDSSPETSSCPNRRQHWADSVGPEIPLTKFIAFNTP